MEQNIAEAHHDDDDNAEQPSKVHVTSAIKRENSKKGIKLQWDEDNLAKNEKIKEGLNCAKIDEPKTPYHKPSSPDFEHYNSIEEDGHTSHADVQPVIIGTAEILALQSTTSEDAELDMMRQRRLSTSSVDYNASRESEPGDDGGESSGGRKRKFDTMRKQHYNMREMLNKGKELLEHEDEDGDYTLN